MSSITHVADTALWVAHYRGVESRRADALFQDPLAEKLSGLEGQKIATSMPYPHMLAWIMAIRTVAIDRFIYEAISDGVDAVLNLGAGLDTRPYRMDLDPKLRWIEVDYPSMIDFKLARLGDAKPQCQLERYALDFSQRERAQELYKKIGQGSRRILVLTEGVIIYLSREQAGMLAEDLMAVPQICYWVQDYRDSSDGAWRSPKRLQRKMKKAPFLFEVPNTSDFFAKYGWNTKKRVYSLDLARELQRPFPLHFPWNLLFRLIPKARFDRMKQASGYLMLERA